MRGYALYCIEQWILWRYDASGGYAKTSPIANIGKPKSAHNGQSLPRGVIPTNREAELANTVFTIMGNSERVGSAEILKQVIGNRQKNATIEATCESLGINSRKYYSALKEFTIMLETIIHYREQKRRRIT